MTAHDVETERSRAVTDRPYNLQVHPVFLGSCDFPGGNRGSEVPLHPAVYAQPRVVRGRFWDLMLSRAPLCLVSVPLRGFAVIDRPYSLGFATVGALYERPR